MELPPDATERLLDTWPVARLATGGADGPRLVPVVFARAEGELWTPVDGKPKRGGELARLRRVREEPRVSLLLDHYDADWARLWWIRLDGRARVVQPSAAPLLEHHPAIDDVDVFPRRGGPSAWWRFLRELRAKRFDWPLPRFRLRPHLFPGP